jgi:hypothetical protein
MHRRCPPAILMLVSAAGTLLLALTAAMGTDYAWDALPSLDALVRGDLGAYATTQPQMGQLALLVRWPAVELASLLGAGDLWGYRLGALTCLVALGILAVVIARAGLARGLAPSAGVATVVFLVANPVTVRALQLGHPEEAMGAALCVAAVLLARAGRPGIAGLTLGLALATKQWALLAVIPTLIAAPAGTRARIAGIGVAVAGAFTLPAFLVSPGAFIDAMNRPAHGLSEMRPGNLWHLVATDRRPTAGGVDLALVPGWLRAIAHPGVALAGFAFPLVWARRQRPAQVDILAVLALVFLWRCVADPWNHEYYHLPFLVSLACWEVLVRGRMPVLTGVSSAILWVVFARIAQPGAAVTADIVYLIWAFAVTAALVAGMSGRRVALRPAPAPAGLRPA